MNNEKFTWVLKSKVTIVALGRTVSNLDLNKKLDVLGKQHVLKILVGPTLSVSLLITTKSFNPTFRVGMGGFPNVKILRFDLPSDAAPGQGINLSIDTELYNPSPIGVVLGTLVLDIGCNGTHLGQVRATGASLLGGAASVLNLTGTMTPQTTPEGLNTVRFV
jgi:hypothetical protein